MILTLGKCLGQVTGIQQAPGVSSAESLWSADGASIDTLHAPPAHSVHYDLNFDTAAAHPTHSVSVSQASQGEVR